MKRPKHRKKTTNIELWPAARRALDSAQAAEVRAGRRRSLTELASTLILAALERGNGDGKA